MAYYSVNPYKVARFQNSLLRKVASDPRLSYGLQKQAKGGVGNFLAGVTRKLFGGKGMKNIPILTDRQAVKIAQRMGAEGAFGAKSFPVRNFALAHPKSVGAAALGVGAAGVGAGVYGVNELLSSDDPADRIKGVLLAYSPYVGGGAALGALLGGGIGAQSDNTLAGSLIGAGGGALLGGAGKAIYDKLNS